MRDGRIVAVAKALPGPAIETIDVRGKPVLPGMIDTHAHVYRHVSGRFGLDADMVGVHSGVTAVVDQGGPSVLTFPGFREFIAKPAASRVLAFISAYMVGGLEGHYYPELHRPDCIAVDDTVKAARENADLMRGIKGNAEIGGFTRWGRRGDVAGVGDQPRARPATLHPLRPALAAARGLPSLRCRRGAARHAEDLAAGRHPRASLHAPSGGFVDRHGKLHPVVREALALGLKTDVGHGSHFSFKMARLVLDAGIVPDTLGADMHGYNTTIPRPLGTPEAHPDKEGRRCSAWPTRSAR